MLPLTKTFDPADLTTLAPEVAFVRLFDLSTQLPARVWEYAMALHAIQVWSEQVGHPPLDLLDVGGAGSPFADMVRSQGITAAVIDPLVNTTIEEAPPTRVDVVTAISVLEHVPHPKACLRACAKHLRPGGLLFLTVDYWDCDGPDTAHFHWMRERIYNRGTLYDLIEFGRDKLHLHRLGPCDWTYHGNQLYGEYTFASTALSAPVLVCGSGGPHVPVA